MAIRVLIERYVKEGREAELSRLLKELRAKATQQPGYISGETLRNVKDGSHLLVISTWQSLEDWQAWRDSPERALIQSKIAQLSTKPTKTTVFTQY